MMDGETSRAWSPGVGGEGRKQEQDFDLNLAPIIDCFVVLIAFVMISAAFASIGILDAGIAAGGAAPLAVTDPEVRLKVELSPDGAIGMQLTGKEAREITLPPLKNGGYDIPAMGQKVAEIKAKWPSLEKTRLTAENKVPYQEVISSIETIRKSIPGVALDGF
ncbi:MAG: hypothetical protein A2X94_03840 [Bdellovibrionales bacterium GWB1_55_8]|nr:MAG: hypothetical protein A2X94_03840 [Bdellovibrionales bacterium GWB1_55_8]